MFKTFEHLNPHTKILLFGCGGGYDIFCGLPLFFWLKERYSDVFLGNFSFTEQLSLFPKYSEGWYVVTNTIDFENNYAPEYNIAKHLNVPVYTYTDTGLRNLEIGMRKLVAELSLDLIVLCDGGCDSIITGFEYHLGTPVEDFMSLLTVSKLQKEGLVNGYLTLLGATVDTFIEINRADFMANLDHLKQSGGLLESTLLTLDQYTSPYIDLFERSQPRNSIVNASIVARLQGCSGNMVPPLLDPVYRSDNFILDDFLITYYLIDLHHIIERVNFVDLIKDLDDSDEIDNVIMACHDHIYANVSNYNIELSYIENKVPQSFPDL